MRLILRPTYHFVADGPGDAPDEGILVREIRDMIGLLNLRVDPTVTAVELRAINAVTEGATMEQIELFLLTANRVLEARRERIRAMPDPEIRKVFAEDAIGIGKKLATVSKEFLAALRTAEVSTYTGLEPNAAERLDARRAAEAAGAGSGEELAEAQA